MQFILALFALFAAANAGLIAAPAVLPATTLVRTPQHDSAIIKSDRLGGNFAYSTVEGHAYAAVSPVVQNVVSPVAVSYTSTPVVTPVARFAAPYGYGYPSLAYSGHLPYYY